MQANALLSMPLLSLAMPRRSAQVHGLLRQEKINTRASLPSAPHHRFTNARSIHSSLSKAAYMRTHAIHQQVT